MTEIDLKWPQRLVFRKIYVTSFILTYTTIVFVDVQNWIFFGLKWFFMTSIWNFSKIVAKEVIFSNNSPTLSEFWNLIQPMPRSDLTWPQTFSLNLKWSFKVKNFQKRSQKVKFDLIQNSKMNLNMKPAFQNTYFGGHSRSATVKGH